MGRFLFGQCFCDGGMLTRRGTNRKCVLPTARPDMLSPLPFRTPAICRPKKGAAPEKPEYFQVKKWQLVAGLMPIQKTSIAGLLIVRWPLFEDVRGFFKQSYQTKELEEALGRIPKLNQGNHSRSRPGVLRGFHMEPWDKLIYVVRGTALCVVADTRPDSPTFARWESITLGDAPGEHARVFVSQGLSNAFYCFSETDYINDVSANFAPEGRRGVVWNDPTLAVEWPDKNPILSNTDAALPTLRSLFPDHARFR